MWNLLNHDHENITSAFRPGLFTPSSYSTESIFACPTCIKVRVCSAVVYKSPVVFTSKGRWPPFGPAYLTDAYLSVGYNQKW